MVTIDELTNGLKKSIAIKKKNIAMYQDCLDNPEIKCAMPTFERELEKRELVLELIEQRNQLLDDLYALSRNTKPHTWLCDICTRPCGEDDISIDACDNFEWRWVANVQKDR